jgi:hypothetical protein
MTDRRHTATPEAHPLAIPSEPESPDSNAVSPSSIVAHPATAVGWISLSELARVLGRGNPRAARDWCVRHDVPYRRDGKHNFARLADVQRALEALPGRADSAAQANARAAATRAAAAIMAGSKR